MITLDPIEMGRMSDDEFDDAERNERIRREALAMMAGGGLPEMPPLDAMPPEATPEQRRPITGGTAYPPGTVPPRDPVTAARGAEDIYGSADPMGGQAPAPLDAGTQGAAQRVATPRPELLAALQQRRQAPPNRQPEPAPNLPAAPPREERPMSSPNPAPGPRAKAGPPGQERDYTGVDVADAIARPFRALGRGFSAFAGRQSGEMSSWGDQARARDRQTDADALTAERARGQMAGQQQDRDLAERRVGVAERSQASTEERQRALTEAGITREDRMARIQERANELRAQGLEASAALTRARMESLQAQQAERASLLDPTSERSLRAVDRFGRRADHVGQMTGRQVDINAEGLSAEDVRAMEQGLSQTRSARAPGGGGSGGGGAQNAEAIRALAREAGLSETEVNAYGTSRRDMERLRSEAEARMRTRSRTGGGGEGIEIAPGVRSTLARIRPADAARLAGGISTARSQAANIRGIGSIAAAHPLGANISPQARAQLTPRLTIARGMVATLGNTGVINATEVPTINGALPNPADLEQMTFGTFQARMREWQRILEERVAADLATNGVDEAGVERVLSWLRGSGGGGSGGEARQGAPPAAGRQRVRLPSGRTTQPLTPEQVRQALERFPGAEVL